MRRAIPVDERLSLTLRFLATGHSYSDLEADFKIHRTTISGIISEVCQAIYDGLEDKYLKLPSTKNEWLAIAEKTKEKWQFPNCIGVADGKHLAIRHPPGSGSDFYNYKGFYSIVLLAIVDYDYKFLFCDVGCQGRISDGGVFRNCSFNKALANGSLNLPDPTPLPRDPNDLTFIHDKSEPLPHLCPSHLIKPYL